MRKINQLYQSFHRFFLGIPAEFFPPLWLWILFAAISVVRLVPATYSQWEDPLYVLVTEVNAPWKAALGFLSNDVVHVVYCVLSKILIKATGHHFVDFVYRIPSLLAAMAIMPLGFAVFSRCGGRLYGTLFGLCAVFLPVFSRYSVDARGYMVMMFTMIWALGLTPGLSVRFHPIRLGIAYFLTGISHGFGMVMVACFAVFGCYTGKERHDRKIFFLNFLLTLPVYFYSIPIIKFMVSLHGDHVPAVTHNVITNWLFVPAWIQYLFGSTWASWVVILFCSLIFAGIIRTFLTSWKNGIALVAFMTCIMALFGITGNNYTLERYAMISLPFWLLALYRGLVWTIDIFPRYKYAETIVAAGMLVLLLLLSPRMVDALRFPEQDYRGAYEMIVRKYPDEKFVFGLAKTYAVGLGYYARQFNLEYKVIEKKEDMSDSAWSDSPMRCIITVAENEISEEMRTWLGANGVLVKLFRGNALPTRLYSGRKK